MRYDFTKIQEQIDEGGMTLDDVAALCGLPKGTISRVLRNGRARQSTALILTEKFHLKMKEILPAEPKRRKTA